MALTARQREPWRSPSSRRRVIANTYVAAWGVSPTFADPRQTRTLELPSDSAFAVGHISQKQQEREEQQRIKNLVLNLDLRESEDPDGEISLEGLSPIDNIHNRSEAGREKPTSYNHNRLERQGKDRGQRVRRLQLSDVQNWYDRPRNRRQEAKTRRDRASESRSLWSGDGGSGAVTTSGVPSM